MEWWAILALVLGIPIVLLPVAFVWYLNVSGLYHVISDARQRQRRRAEALRKTEKAVRGRVLVGTANKREEESPEALGAPRTP